MNFTKIKISIAIYLLLAIHTFGAVPFSIRGGHDATIVYTPEHGIDGWNRVRVSAVYPGGSLAKSIDYVAMWGIWQDMDGIKFGMPESLLADTIVAELKVRLDGYLLPGMSLPCSLLMGHQAFSYSPYTVDISNRVKRNYGRKGVLLEGIKHNNGELSSFVFWDGGPKNIAWGGKDVWRPKNTISLINIFVDSSKVNNENLSKDLVYSGEIKARNKLGNINLLLARNWKGEAKLREDIKYDFSDLINFEGEYFIVPGSASLIFGYKDFGYKDVFQKFDPAYRNEVDENEYDNRLEAPLDLYMGKKGYNIGFSTDIFPFSEDNYLSITTTYENYIDRTTITRLNPNPVKLNYFSVGIEGELFGFDVNSSVKLGQTTNYPQEELLNRTKFRRFEIRMNKKVERRGKAPIYLSWRWEDERWPNVNNPSRTFEWIERELKIETVLRSGSFNGAKVGCFLLQEPKRLVAKERIGILLDYKTPALNGLLFKVRLAVPNLWEDSYEYYDPFGRKRDSDNSLKVIAQYEF